MKADVSLLNPGRQAVAPAGFRRVSVMTASLLGLALAWAGVAAQADVSPLRWSGPPGSRPGTYQQWAAHHPAQPFSWNLTKYDADGPEPVALVVEQALAGPLALELDQFTLDLQNGGHPVSRYEVSGGTPEALRSLLRDAWAQDSIVGALLIGDLPVPWFQGVCFGTYEEWPVDLFYMDLDNAWSDFSVHGTGDTLVPGSDGIYDSIERNIDLEIFVGRLTLTGFPDPVGLVRNYLHKDHEFRNDTSAVEDRALIFVDDDWRGQGPGWSRDLGLAFPDRTECFDPETTRAAIYRPMLDTPRTWVSVFAHSWSGGHTFDFDSARQRDYYYGYEYTTQDVPARFYNHFACWFCRYTDSACGGAQSIFNPSYGLGAVGSAKSGSMLDFASFYAPLGSGQSIGAAYKLWFDHVCASGYAPTERMWTMGMTLLGDPFLPAVPPCCDAAVKRICAPAGWVDSGFAIAPAAVVGNAGNATGSLTVTMTIDPGYSRSLVTPVLLPGDTMLVTFDSWQPSDTGTGTVTCRAVCAGDRHRANDSLRGTFTVRLPDVGAARILVPAGVIDSGPLVPRVVVRNYSGGEEQFWVHVQIDDEQGNVCYRDSAWADDVPGWGYGRAVLPAWSGMPAAGAGNATAWTSRPRDRHRENDSVQASFRVVPGVPPPQQGWHRMADMPSGARKKTIGSGGALAAGTDGLIYALKGNNTGQFYGYDPCFDRWVTLESIPKIGSTGKKRGVKKGGALVWAGGDLYAVKGNKTSEFWHYREGRGWVERRPAPPDSEPITCGAGLAWLGPSIYLLKGSKTQSGYSYWIDGDTWHEEKLVIPYGGSSEGMFARGSALGSDGDNRLFALKGKYNEFFSYDIARDEWHELIGLPSEGRSGHKRNAKDGTSLACCGGRLYVLKGGSNELWSRDTSLFFGLWHQLEDFPSSGKKKLVKGGGALAWCEYMNSLYALRGANTLELWAYTFADSVPVEEERPVRPLSARPALRVEPNPFGRQARVVFSVPQPGRVRVRLYDALGAVRAVLVEGTVGAGWHRLNLAASKLPQGIYLLRLDAGTCSVSVKLVRS